MPRNPLEILDRALRRKAREALYAVRRRGGTEAAIRVWMTALQVVTCGTAAGLTFFVAQTTVGAVGYALMFVVLGVASAVSLKSALELLKTVGSEPLLDVAASKVYRPPDRRRLGCVLAMTVAFALLAAVAPYPSTTIADLSLLAVMSLGTAIDYVAGEAGEIGRRMTAESLIPGHGTH